MPESKFAQQRRAALAQCVALLALAAAALACNVQFGGAVRTPIGTLTAAVVMLAPSNNSRIAEGATVEIAATAHDETSGVARIEFFLNGVSIGSQNAPIAEGQTEFTARMTWQAQGVQGHFITAEASRADGSRIGEAGVTFEVVVAQGLLIAQEASPTASPTVGVPPSVTPQPDQLSEQPTEQESEQPTEPPSAQPTEQASLESPPVGSPAATATLLIQIQLSPGPILASPTPGSEQAAQLFVTQTPAPELTTATPEPTTAPPAERPTLRVIYPFLNVRNGPGTTFNKIGELKNGDTATIMGRNEDRTWWAVEKGDLRGWVINDKTFINVIGDTMAVPLATSGEAPTPTSIPATPNLAPTSTVSGTADLVIDSATVEGQPKAGETFFVSIVIRNAGTVESGSFEVMGIFQPGNERSPVGFPSLPAGAVATIRMPVTLRTGGPNQTGTIMLDDKNEVDEGPNGEQNNVRMITYNVQ